MSELAQDGAPAVRRIGEAIDEARAEERHQRDDALLRQLEREAALIEAWIGKPPVR